MIARHSNAIHTVKGLVDEGFTLGAAALILWGAPKLKSSKLRKLTRDIDSIIKQTGLKKK